MDSIVSAVPGASKILGTALHHLDIDNNTCDPVRIPEDSDLEVYLDILLAEIAGKPQSRAYTLVSDSTECAVSLAKFHDAETLVKDAAQALASRLLRIEIATDERYGHLAAPGTTHVKRGSFLQFLYKSAGVLGYLAVKVEHQSILDETDFKRRVGLGESQKIYKACRVGFDAHGKPQQALVFDTNAKPSVYWWNDVWELAPVRSDELNTKEAIKHVVHALQKIKKYAPVDYNILRNASVAAFKQTGAIDFDKFVTSTFSSYSPVADDLASELPNLVTRLRELPKKKGFDSHFTLAPAAVPYNKVKVQLNTGISLSYDEGLAHLSDRIWSTTTKDGKEVVVVDAPGASKHFPSKPWE
ncbi:hypothetical protein [Oleiagrimonas sp. MCCC 1A03011]|uniref:hypothetical protein n=1 Tax=Oleiagrimonas sp. MCCC 1A03011 TaxID=1926883 RepID=UPI000DC45683|nr:hypothetical protein [Oleiagrimonas sp. MCCC 1A03011]RAP57104.1 hypothetical protein BTJ49_11065 [Oleiagrimonas sp. MCCC 1A03011]